MKILDYLKLLVSKEGSDLYLTIGAPPAAKVQGLLMPLDKEKITRNQITDIACGLMTEEQQGQFEKDLEMNLAWSEKGVGRFRVNIFKQRNNLAVVIRNIKFDIPTFDSLGLPEQLKPVVLEKRGLILFTGGTGTGKSSSLAAMIKHRNDNLSGHIITIEDPIEFVHPHKKCLVSQREIGVDTHSYEDALKNTLRQAPDVILIGEIKTREAMEYAIAFAEAGHLCLSTVAASNINQAMERIINFFPKDRRSQLWLDLSLNLRAFVSQRLVPKIDGKQTAAFEVLLGTQTVRDLIQKGEIHDIKGVMEKYEEIGMQTIDMHLLRLYKQDVISLDEAFNNSDSPTNLKLTLSLSKDHQETNKSDSDGLDSLSLIEHVEEDPDEDEDKDENQENTSSVAQFNLLDE